MSLGRGPGQDILECKQIGQWIPPARFVMMISGGCAGVDRPFAESTCGRESMMGPWFGPEDVVATQGRSSTIERCGRKRPDETAVARSAGRWTDGLFGACEEAAVAGSPTISGVSSSLRDVGPGYYW